MGFIYVGIKKKEQTGFAVEFRAAKKEILYTNVQNSFWINFETLKKVTDDLYYTEIKEAVERAKTKK